MITVNKTPDPVSYIGDCIELKFTSTDVEVGTISRKFVFQICDDQGNTLSKEQAIRPKEGKIFSVRIDRDLKSFVYTPVPLTGTINGSPFAADEMKKDIIFKYWEYVFDSATCEEPIKENEGQLGFTILNSAIGYRENKDGFLNTKANDIQLCRDSEDFLYFCIEQQATVTINWLDCKGQIVSTNTFPVPENGVTGVGVGPANFFPNGLPSNIEGANVTVSGGANISYNYQFDECCCDSIYFMSSKGGYSVLGVERKTATISRDFEEICNYQPNCDLKTVEGRTIGGQMVSNVSIENELVFTKFIDAETCKDQAYLIDFMKSGAIFIKECDVLGNEILVRFLPRSGSLRYSEKESYFVIQIRGQIATKEGSPNFVNY